MLVPNRHGSSNSYRYGFQGQEKDDELKGEGNSLNYTFRMHDPRVGRFFATDPLEKKYPYMTPYQFSSNSPIMAIELEGLESSVEPNALYTNTRTAESAKSIVQSGFNGAKYSKYSNYNWFSPVENATNTGRSNTGVTLKVEGINTKNAYIITTAQTDAFTMEAMKDMGYTEETWNEAKKKLSKTEFSKLHQERNGRMWEKVGNLMDKLNKSVYKTEIDGNFAVSDKVANRGKITQISGKDSKTVVNLIRGTKYLQKTLVVVGIANDVYNIYTSENRAKTITKTIGGWVGAYEAASVTGVALASTGIDAAGPWGWVAHGVITLGAGVGGYFVGETAAEIIYERLETKGWVPGGKE